MLNLGSKGAEVAQSATTHNYLTHDQLARVAKRLASCAPDSGCYQETLRAFYKLSLDQDIQAIADCASAAQACKVPSLSVQRTMSDLDRVKDLVANSSSEAGQFLQYLINSNIGFQEQLAVSTGSHSTNAMVEMLQAKWGFSDATATSIKENLTDTLKLGAGIGAVRFLSNKTGSSASQGGMPRAEEITLSRKNYPESASHIEDAIAAGQPAVITLDRPGAKPRRRDSLAGTAVVAGKDRDEYPPAMSEEGGKGASVRPISPSDNRGAGACIGAQCRKLPDGTKIFIRITE